MAAQKVSGIYEIVNLVNGKRYVGSAIDIRQRWREHRKHLRAGTHPNRHLLNAWAKHGETAFCFNILKTCEADSLIAEEQAEFDRSGPEYNICPTAGSTLGRKHSGETRKKIGAKKVGKAMPTRDEEHRAKLSAAHKGKKKDPARMAALQAARDEYVYTDADRAAKSEAMKRAYAEGRRDRARSPEYREKIAASLRGRKATEEHRAKQAAAQTGKKRGPYNLDPAKAEARREAGERLAGQINERRWGSKAP